MEIVYPEDDEYELDSDYDEDEEASPGDSDCERTLGAPEGQTVYLHLVCTRLLRNPGQANSQKATLEGPVALCLPLSQ